MTARTYNVGNIPPQIVWTVVRGDTAAFKVLVTDDNRQPLVIGDWDIKIDIKRNDLEIAVLYPEATLEDATGEFTVSLTSAQSEILQTNDIFDIQLSDPTRVWTIAQGKMSIIEDVTD
jgi:hypothetical protein